VFIDSIPSRDSVKAGYGFQDAGQFYEGGIFFYHFDDQGSTAYVTDFKGVVVQHVEYAPSGESILSEQNGTFASVYLFKGKGYDEETGYYFFGPQYYDPVLSQWLNLPDPSGEGFLSDAMNSYGQNEDVVDDDEEMVSNPDIEEIEYSGSRETENEWGESKAKSEEAESKEKRRQANKPRRNAIANKYSNMLFDLKYSRKKAKEMFGEMEEESEVLDGHVYKGGANVHNGHIDDIDDYDGEDAINVDEDDNSDYDIMGNAKKKPEPRKAGISVSRSRSNSRYTNYGIGLLRRSISRAPSEVVIHRGSSAADVIIHKPSAIKRNSLSRNSLSIKRSGSGRP
jgi:RHS repeat-associated protein